MKDKEQLKEDALKRWKPILEKLGVPIGEKLDMLSEYAQAHHDALNNSEMPKINLPLATTDIDELNKFQGPTGLKLPDVSIMNFPNIVPLAYRIASKIFEDIKLEKIDLDDENVDDHF